MNDLTAGDQSGASETDRAFAEWVASAGDRLRCGEGLDFTLDPDAAAHPEWVGRLRRLLRAMQALDRQRPRLGLDATSASGPTAIPGLDVRSVGDFRTVRELGRGGMGVVYEAIEGSLKRRVALKLLPSAQADDPARLRRFRVEARAAARLNHPHIVPVYAVGTDQGVHYFTMQLIEGRTLAQVIAGARAQTDRLLGSHRAAAALCRQAAEALQYAHERGVIHRDIKPSNLLVDGRGWLWVADFGLALLHGSGAITATGTRLGTLRYMSPEQTMADRDAVDHRVDIYSLGATLYELLTLRPAFAGENLLRRIAQEKPIPPRRINPNIPKDLEKIVLTAMAKRPADRYATANDLAADLTRFLEDQPVVKRQSGFFGRAVNWSKKH